MVSDVYPERSGATAKGLRERWWQFEAKALDMRRATSRLEWFIALPEVSKLCMPVIVNRGPVYNHKVIVIASDDPGIFGLVSSNMHWLWAVTQGGTMRSDPSYTPSACFETLPLPPVTRDLSQTGQLLIDSRRRIHARRDIGLTRLYNLVNNPEIIDAADPDVARLREIHAELDKAVVDAYGWSDIRLDHGFHRYRQMKRWTVSPAARVEILDRLLEENHRRAAAEAAASPKKVTKGRKVESMSEGMETLFS